MIVANPTRGLDVGAIEFIHKRLIEQRDKYKAVLLISFELEEILNVSDRIAVIHEGEIVGIVDPKETSENELGLLMAGYTLEEARKELEKGLAHMNDRSEKFRNLLVPVLSVVLGLILGAILMAAFQPIQGYSSMLDAALGSQRGIGETLRQATPLILQH